MKEVAFQLQFQDLINDYDIATMRGDDIAMTNILRKMHKLIGIYLAGNDNEMYRDKCPENGAD